jgi:hypothetical protein
MQTIVELPEFLRKSDKLLKESERQSVISYLALHPESGLIIQCNELAKITSLLVKNYGGSDD